MDRPPPTKPPGKQPTKKPNSIEKSRIPKKLQGPRGVGTERERANAAKMLAKFLKPVDQVASPR